MRKKHCKNLMMHKETHRLKERQEKEDQLLSKITKPVLVNEIQKDEVVNE